MKIAPIVRELKRQKIPYGIIHTGQHYDYEMSESFFKDLEIPQPDYYLGAGSGTHAEQTAKIMVEYEKICVQDMPDLCMVVGDVNSTLACSIVAKKLGIKVAHVEAGLRSRDMSMPEEINRIVTDSISDLFFVTEKSAIENLLKEGKPEKNIFFVGHVMIDNLFYQLNKLEERQIKPYFIQLKQRLNKYTFLTLHRPSNVDKKDKLAKILDVLSRLHVPIIFPIHPRTKKRLEEFDLKLPENIISFQPLSFSDSLFLWKDALCVLTDSGGLQEETTALGIPCLTLRENTERPITVEIGSNTIIGEYLEKLPRLVKDIEEGRYKKGKIPDKWDGKASKRIIEVLAKFLN
ncbi:UDP-N-acetylglucosamine 2-epimerase (non-hydrolyzing) [Desulfothermus naphthae]